MAELHKGFMSEGIYIGEYTYREHVYQTRGTHFEGYEHERYDGTDEADPFRVESGAEMAAKGRDNALLQAGYLRPGAGAARVPLCQDNDDAGSDGGDGSKTPTASPAAMAMKRDVEKYVAPQRRSRGRQTLARKLDLHAVLSDPTVQRKYGFDSVFVAQLRVVKDSDPVEAAAMAQQFLRENDNFETIVKTDKTTTYTRSEAIAELASYASMSKAINSYMDAKIILSKRGDTLHLLPAPYTKDAAEADEWEIMAPISSAKYAVDYYRLVSDRGYDDAHILAGQAAAVLGISVVFTSPRLAMMHPSRVPHAANADINAPFDFSNFSVTRDPVMLEIAKATGPITHRGMHWSFSVAVAGKARLLNAHVRCKATSVKFAGKELRKYQTYRLNNDMWAFYDTAHDGNLHGVARTRAPKVGEFVRVVLPTSSGNVMTTQWAAIRPGREATWVLDMPYAAEVMQPGMSGAPVVSADGFVVGIHDGLSTSQAIFLPVPETIAGEIPMELALDRCLAYGPPGSPHLALVEFDLRKKSKQYRTNNELIMQAMDNDDTRTMLSCYDTRMYVSGKSGDTAIPGLEYKLTATGARGKSGMLPVRAATVGEHVVIVGKTDDGIYGTPVMSTQDIGASPFFAVDLCGEFGPTDFFNGALVVAIDDCMVVGFVTAQGVVSYGASDTVIMAWKCHDVVVSDELSDKVSALPVASSESNARSLPMMHRHSSSGGSTSASSDMFTFTGVAAAVAGVDTVEALRKNLTEIFPFLPMTDDKLFPTDGLDEVFTHASMGKYAESSRKVFSSNRYWARMGDAAMSYLMTKQMFEMGVADDKATIIKSKVQNAQFHADVDRETVKVSRVVAFLNDWVQSLLISTDKKIEVDGEGVIEACLDYRCWMIFKFCLEESLRLQVSLSFSRNLLRAIGCVARNVLSVLTVPSVRLKESFFTGSGFELYSVVLDCVSLVFLSHGGLSNENLDLWILSILPVLEFVRKVYGEKLEGGNVGVFALRFSCLVLEPFAKFLRVHPTRKNGFRDFVDKLLEPLLHLLGVLHLQSDESNPGWTRNLLVAVEEVLSQGLFHPTHIDGFLSLRVAEKYSASNDGETKESKTVIQSYHRHFFDKLERIILAKKESAMSGLGELFYLLVDRVKKQKETLVLSDGMKIVERTEGSRHLSGQLSKTLYGSSTPLDTSYGPSILSAEKRKSLFNFFVQITDPLLLEINGYLQSKLEVRPLLLDVHCTIKSINNLLACFLREKLYVKTEDISEGACLNFLKKVYNAILPFMANLLCLPTYNVDSRTQETLTLLARELLAVVGHLLDIEYEVIENDLTRLWFIMLSCLAFGYSFKDAPNECSMTSQILGLGCQLVKLYSELRQVKSTIFAICKATRLIIVYDKGGDAGLNYDSLGFCKISLPHASYAKAVEMLFCSHEFKLAIRNDIYSIPEGQASECIQHLTADLSESMEWMKTTCSLADEEVFGESNANSSMHGFDLQVELFGRGLSEVYALVLDSLNVTAGNSSIVGRTMKDLMAVIRPYMSILVGPESESVNEFISSVTGRTSDVSLAGNTHYMLKFGVSTHWVLVFFSRMYMSCRSLYRQAVSLMPPDVSRKMSAVMGDPFTAYSARDWMNKTDWTDGGYFSWILQPSASLPVIIQSVSDIYLQGDVADCCPLIYALLTMALQRLVDLNRQIKSFEYLQQSNDNIIQFKLLDDAGSSLHSKRSRKCGKRIAVFKQEAIDLTEFLMSYLSLLDNERLPVNSSNAATFVDTCNQALHGSDKWVFGVSSVNEKSLPAAIWWIICQNIDIWSPHASKKKLKMFIKHVILTSLPYITKGCTQVERHHTNEAHFLDKISLHQISAELLADSVLYEHKFVRRHLASRVCNLLEKSILPLFGDVKLNMSPKWKEGLSALENSYVVLGRKSSTRDELTGGKPASHLLSEMAADISRESTAVKFTACQSLLRLLCWMPKGYINSKSFSLYVTSTLNLERLVIGHLLECGDSFFSHKQYELLRLLVACRRALKCLIMAYCEEKVRTTHSALIPVLSEDVHSVLWLSRSVSVVVRLQETLSEDKACEVADMIFSLMDHTSYVFLTLSKYQCPSAVSIISEKPYTEQLNSDVTQEQSNVNGSLPCLDTSNDVESCKSVILIAESLKEQAQDLIISLKDAHCNEKSSDEIDVDWNKLSSMVSCFSGFMWGLASALDHSNATDSDYKAKLLRWKCEVISKISHCINAFADFICFSFHMLFVKDDLQPNHLSATGNFVKSDDRDSSLVSGDSWKVTVNKHGSQSENVTSIAGILSKLDSYECLPLNKEWLQSFLEGDHPKAAVLIRQLLIAVSAIVKLNLETKCTPLLSSLVPSFTGISQVLLLKLADGTEVPKPFSFVWLDGALKYLQELGSHFPITNPTSTRSLFSKLLELHLKALGKCISLQGKGATLTSHDKELSTNTLHSHIGSASLSHPNYLDEFKARLRMSFKSLIRKPSELHLLSAIQAIERALVGVYEGCPIIYEITTGNVDGGKVSSTVAAGIDCLDLVLEYVSGRKRLNVVKRNIQSLVAALFNIILHVQSPLIFYRIAMDSERYNGPDPGAVILMCVEVLTRVSGKHALFQMDSWHVAQSLHIPAALFQDFDQLRISQGPALSNSLLNSGSQDCNTVGGRDTCVVDLQFSVELYTACCRLLYTILKHHKSESERCISLLQESERVLLHCLEMVDVDLSVRKGYFSLGVHEGVKCASSFRRIYEELRQQKDVFGQHCFKFLSNYIWVYSGYGPLKTGIRREIDEALRPGVYALIDSCSADDLQYLHSVFGEGPCRNTLATLQHDYKLNFQYEGKV